MSVPTQLYQLIHMENSLTIHLINRHDRPQRLLSSLTEIRKLTGSHLINLVNAVTPQEAENQRHRLITREAYQNIQNRGPSTLVLPTWGAVACAASHYQCWQNSTWSDHSFHLVLEDDIHFSDLETFQFDLMRALDILKSEQYASDNTSMTERPTIFLFNSSARNYTKQLDNGLESVIGQFTKTHCYLLNYKAAKYLQEYCHRFTYQLDIQIGLLSKIEANKQFGLRVFNFPNSGTEQQTGFTSDIQPLMSCKTYLSKMCQRLPHVVCDHINSYLDKPEYYYYNSTERIEIPNNTCSFISGYYM